MCQKQTASVFRWNTSLWTSNSVKGTKNVQIHILLGCYLFLSLYFTWRRKQPFCLKRCVCIYSVTMEEVQMYVSDSSHVTPLSKDHMFQLGTRCLCVKSHPATFLFSVLNMPSNVRRGMMDVFLSWNHRAFVARPLLGPSRYRLDYLTPTFFIPLW
jgi:hypothetical protein